MNSLVAITIILVVFAIGDMIAVRTKSIVSMLFTASAFFLVAFWLGLPTTIFEDSTLLSLGSLMVSFLLVHMGTMLNLQQLKEQWKTVIICAAAILGTLTALLFIVAPFFDIETVLTGAPPLSGGVIAGIQMSEAANTIGRTDLALLASLLVVVQGFAGYPLASWALKKEANAFKIRYRNNEIQKTSSDKEETKRKKAIPSLSSKFESNNVYLAKIALVALVAYLVSTGLTSLLGFQLVDQNIMSLLAGLLFSELGFLEKNILKESNSYGIAMAALIVVILSNLTTATFSLFVSILPSLIISILVGALGNILFSIMIGKIFKVNIWMSMALGITALFGFPGTIILPTEVANTNFDDPDEKEQYLNHVTAPMLVGGFVTVSIGSVVLAGFLGPILMNIAG